MNLNENIGNAFSVVRNTHENIDKLMKYCDNISENNGYVSIFDKFLRYNSDVNTRGWVYDTFIKLYQHVHDKDLENQYKKGPIFSLEINLKSEPIVRLSLFDYLNMEGWSEKIYTSDFWGFYDPINRNINGIERIANKENEITTLVVKDEKVGNDYWGLNRILTKSLPLTELTSENVVDNVFKNFDLLKIANIELENL